MKNLMIFILNELFMTAYRTGKEKGQLLNNIEHIEKDKDEYEI